MKDLEDGGEGAEGSDEEGGEVGSNWIESIDGHMNKWATPTHVLKNAWELGMERFSL